MLVPPELNPVMPMGVGEVFEGVEADKNAMNNCFCWFDEYLVYTY